MNTIKILFVSAAVLLCGSLNARNKAAKYFDDLPASKSIVEIGNRVANVMLDSELGRYTPAGSDKPQESNKVSYSVVSLWANSIEFAHNVGDKAMEKALIEKFEPCFGEKAYLCSRTNHVDFSIFGAIPLEIYLMNGDKRCYDMGMHYADNQWASPTEQDSVSTNPSVRKKQQEWWDKGYSTQTRLWIDDMYMITFLQLQAYRVTNDRKYLDRAAKEMVLYLDEIQNPDGLFYHAPDVPFVWGRGDGWVAAGMPMILKYLPEDSEYYKPIAAGFRKMMSALLEYQREDGLWGQIITDPEFWSETSCTAMFTFAFIEGVNQGLLPAGKYGRAARKAWEGLCAQLDDYGQLKEICTGTGKRNDRQWYMDRPRIVGNTHGQAPMLWICNALLGE